jgi:hypothetical protein
VKWPFRRNKKDDVPAEIQEYYQAERRERAGIAWVVGLATLLITLAVVLGLFYGGRWLYRTVVDGDRTPPTTQTETPGEPAPQDQPGDSPDGTESTDGENPATPPQSETPGDQDGQQGGSGSTDTGSPDTDRPTSPQTGGPGASGLPDSGPGEVLGIFAVTSLAAAAAHHFIQSRRFER